MNIHACKFIACQYVSAPSMDEASYPAVSASNAIHQRNGRREQAAKRTGQGCCREEDGGSDTEFVSLVPAAHVVIRSGEQAGFCQAKNEAAGLDWSE